jgi:hypothetical protein
MQAKEKRGYRACTDSFDAATQSRAPILNAEVANFHMRAVLRVVWVILSGPTIASSFRSPILYVLHFRVCPGFISIDIPTRCEAVVNVNPCHVA